MSTFAMHVAKTGLNSQQIKMQVIANNLANVNTTGFKADQFMRPMTITGRNGLTLEKAWESRPKAYMAISIPDFPNFFMLNGPGGPVGNFSLIDIAEQQWQYIAQLIELLAEEKCAEIAVKPEALEQFDRERIAAAKTTIFGSGCQSWYLDAEEIEILRKDH